LSQPVAPSSRGSQPSTGSGTPGCGTGDGRAAEGHGGVGEAFDDELERYTVAITLTNRVGESLRTWELEGAFPVRWTGPNFSASDQSPLVEELEIAHHGFKSTTHKSE